MPPSPLITDSTLSHRAVGTSTATQPYSFEATELKRSALKTHAIHAADNPETANLTASGHLCSTKDLRQSANLTIETAFVSSSLILVDQALSSHVIQHGSSFFQSGFRIGFITSSDGCEYSLYHRAHHRALARVALSRFFGLANAFACLSSVGHGLSSSLSVLNSAAHYPPRASSRQHLYQ